MQHDTELMADTVSPLDSGGDRDGEEVRPSWTLHLSMDVKNYPF